MSTNFEINLHGVTYREYANFINVYSSGKLREAMKQAARFILRWDYDVSLEPTKDKPHPLLQLSMEDGAAVTRALFEHFKTLYDNAKVSDVEVSFKAWNMDRFTEFDELRKAGDVAAYEPMLHEVASMAGVDPEKSLTMYQGIVIMKAVAEKSNKVFAGGN